MAQNITEDYKSDCRAEYAPYRYWIYTNSGTAGSYTH